jgi:hypothetical protein
MIHGILKPLAPLSVVRLDWRAYFEQFKELHGEPMRAGGRQLFPDGWMYSLTDYGGPEWPPPDDPAVLKRLQTLYWRLRRRQATQQLAWLGQQVEGLKELQRVKSAPLQQRQVRRDDVGGVVETTVATVDLNLSGLEQRLAWLEEDLAVCEQKLNELTGASDEERTDGQTA